MFYAHFATFAVELVWYFSVGGIRRVRGGQRCDVQRALQRTPHVVDCLRDPSRRVSSKDLTAKDATVAKDDAVEQAVPLRPLRPLRLIWFGISRSKDLTAKSCCIGMNFPPRVNFVPDRHLRVSHLYPPPVALGPLASKQVNSRGIRIHKQWKNDWVNCRQCARLSGYLCVPCAPCGSK